MKTTRFNLTIVTTDSDTGDNTVQTYDASTMDEILAMMGYEVDPSTIISLQGIGAELVDVLAGRPFQAGDRVQTAYGCGTIVGMSGDSFFVHMDDGMEGQSLLSFPTEEMSLLESNVITPGGIYKRFSHVVPSGRAAVPVRQINGYGDNPWVLGMTERDEDDNGLDTNKTDTSKTSTKNVMESAEDTLQRIRHLSGL